MENIKEIVSLAQQLQESIDLDNLTIIGVNISDEEINIQLWHPSFLETFEDYERDTSYSKKSHCCIYKVIEGVKFFAIVKLENLAIKKDHSAK